MLKYKYLLLDLDGTLLNQYEQISETTLLALNKLMAEGTKIVLISSRPYRLMIQYKDMLCLSSDSIMVCRDGLSIYNGDGQLIHQEKLMQSIDLKNIIHSIPHAEVSAFTEREDYLIPSSFIKYFVCKLFFFVSKNKRLRVVRRVPKEIMNIEKIIIRTSVEFDVWRMKINQYEIFRMKDGTYQVNTAGVTKYSAICYLVQEGLFSLEDVLYFGDDDNDRQCFENLPNCVAMGNAIDELKKLALFVTKKNTEDGVAYAIDKLLWNESTMEVLHKR